MSKIINACDRPLNAVGGTVPDVSGGLHDYYQLMVFTLLEKTISGFQVVENAEPINLRGVIQPFSARQLLLKPEGQRSWAWYTLHSEPSVVLKTDDVVDYLGVQYRVMSKTDYSLYGYVQYEMINDWTGSGP